MSFKQHFGTRQGQIIMWQARTRSLAVVVAVALAGLVGLPLTSSANTTTSPDTVGTVGVDPSVVLDASGFPVVAYFDDTNGDLKVLHCGDPNCTAGNSIATPDSAGIVGLDPSLALDAAGNPVVSYMDFSNGDLKILHCGNANCAAGNSVVTADSVNVVGWASSIVLDSSGNPVVSYRLHNSTFNERELKILHCGNPNCSAGNTVATPDSGGDVGSSTSIALDASGFPVVSYQDFASEDLKILHCVDVGCMAGHSLTSPDTAGDVGRHSSLALDAAGLPVISYVDATNGAVKVMHCGDATCSSGNSIVTADPAGSVGPIWTSLTLDAAGRAVVAYHVNINELRVLHCGNVNCSAGNSITAPFTGGFTDTGTSIVLDAVGFPVVAYLDAGSGDLSVLHCSNANCAPPAFCNGLGVTIDMNNNGGNGVGTAGNDVILGTAGADTISGLGGDDTVCGGGGPDLIRGGAGNDSLFGEGGADEIRGGGGSDTIDGGDAGDTLTGQGGGDTIDGGRGNDTIDGQGAADTIDGGLGNDTVGGQNGGDTIDGGAGADTLKGQTGPDILRGDGDDDTMLGGEGADTLFGGSGFDKCSGNTGPDSAEAATCEQTPGVETLF